LAKTRKAFSITELSEIQQPRSNKLRRNYSESNSGFAKLINSIFVSKNNLFYMSVSVLFFKNFHIVFSIASKDNYKIN